MYMTYDQYIRRLAWRFWHGDYDENDIELAEFALDIKTYIESHPSEFGGGYMPQ